MRTGQGNGYKDESIAWSTNQTAEAWKYGVIKMHFALTEEQQMIIDTTKAFVENELYPHEMEIEKTGHLDMDLIKEVQKKASIAVH